MAAIPAGSIACLFCSTAINFMSGKHDYFLHLEKEHLIQTNQNILMAVNFLDKGTLEDMVGQFEKTFHVIMKFEKEAIKDNKNMVCDVESESFVILSETESRDDLCLQITDNNNDAIIVDDTQIYDIAECFNKKVKKNPITVVKESNDHFKIEDTQIKDITELFNDKIKEDPECSFEPAKNMARKSLSRILPKSKLTSSFSCDSCEEKFDSKCLLSKHILMQCDSKSFKCDFCGVKFPLLTLLDKHTSRKHQAVNRKKKIAKKENVAKQSQMLNTFNDIRSLEMEGINENINMDHDCKEDSLPSTNPTDGDKLILSSNKNNETLIDEDGEAFIKKDSGSSFQPPEIKSKKLTSQSISQKSEETNLFSCDSCEEDFKSNGQLSKHILMQCDIKSFKCDFCGVKFPLLSLLDKHTSRRHQAVNRKKKTVEKENLAKPAQIFNPFNDITSLEIEAINDNINMDHVGKADSLPSMNHTDKLIGNSNENNDTLIDRETQVNDIKELFTDQDEEVLIKKDPESSFQPPEIKRGKVTSQPISQKSEVTNSFSCDSCEEDFKSNGQLSKHILMQCDVIKSFNCDFCGVKFPLLSLLNKHISRKHQTINRKRKLENKNM